MCIQKRKASFFWLLVLVGMFVFPTFSLATTLHAILVSDTNDASIGPSVQVDQRKLQGLMRSISEYTGMTLSSHSVSGNQLNRANVERAISSVSNVGSDDVIFFFWSGHGFNDESSRSKYPTMHLGNWQNTLGLESVANMLKQKKPRLLIVIGDTCNKPMGGSRGEEMTRGEKDENYKKLFLKSRGTILASSSIKGQYSYGNNQTGGLYTSAFLSNLSKELASSGTPSWKTLMGRANAPINVGSGVIQQPQFDIIEGGGTTDVGTTDGQNSCEVIDEKGIRQTCGAPPSQGPLSEPDPEIKEDNGKCVEDSYYKDKATKQECCKTEGGGKKCWADWESN